MFNDTFGFLGLDTLMVLATAISIWFAMKYTCELYLENPWLQKPVDEDEEHTKEELEADPLLKRKNSDEWLIAAVWAAITVLAFFALREFAMARENPVLTLMGFVLLLIVWSLTALFAYDVYYRRVNQDA